MIETTQKLALEGGSTAVPAHLVDHDWERYRKAGKEEIDAVVEVMRSGHLSIAVPVGMPQSEALEKAFCEWTRAKYALAVCNGTAALHCAVAGVGVEAGDEVIVPAFSFIASALAVLHHNAIPVFVDIDPETYTIDTSKIEAEITERTRAIMAVHVYGLPADMDAVKEIAGRHGLKVVEDSAQAYGSLYRGQMTGTIGDAAGFSMCTTKQLMTGEGGLMTSNSKEVYDRAAMTRLFGEPGEGLKADVRAYMNERIGWNYKMPEVISALAQVKLKHLDGYISATQRNAEYLTQRLKGIEGLATPTVPEDRTHTYYIYSVQVDPEKLNLDVEAGKLRNAVLQALQAENVDAALWQKVPLPAQTVLQRKIGYGNGSPWREHGSDVTYDLNDYPNAFAILDNSFCVRRLIPPNGSELMDRYVEAFEKVFGQIDRVMELYDATGEYMPLKERKARLVGQGV